MKILKMLLVGSAVGATSYWLSRASLQRRRAARLRGKEADHSRWEDEGGTPAATPLDTPEPDHVARPAATA